MEFGDTIVFFVEIVGTIAFALSGAVMAVQRRMDIFGVLVLGVCTAVGGGVIRDLLLGITPPNTFRNPVYALVAALASALIFFVGRSVPEIILTNRIQNLSLFNFVDAMGLGIFTVIGICRQPLFADFCRSDHWCGRRDSSGYVSRSYACCIAQADLCVGILCWCGVICLFLSVCQSLDCHALWRCDCGDYSDVGGKISLEPAGGHSRRMAGGKIDISCYKNERIVRRDV